MNRQLAVLLTIGFMALLGIAIFAGLPVLGKGWLSVQYKQVWDLLSKLLEQKPGGLSYALVVLAFCAAALSGLVPLSMLAVMTGSFFGFGAEVLIAAAGGTGMGALLSFSLARYGLRRPLESWVSKRISVARFDRAIAERNWRFVLLIRLSPVAPFSFISYAFGLSQVRLVDFLLGTAGSLPALTAYVYSGALSRNLFSVFAGQYRGPKWLQVSLLIAGILSTIMAVVMTGQIVKNAFRVPLEAETEPKHFHTTQKEELRNRDSRAELD